jgi:hypothetical protein
LARAEEEEEDGREEAEVGEGFAELGGEPVGFCAGGCGWRFNDVEDGFGDGVA